jgi:hypothetical protein
MDKLPLNLSINLTLLFNGDIEQVLVESYKYNKKEKELIVKIIKNYAAMKSIKKVYFTEYIGTDDTISESLTMKIKNSFMNGVSMVLSTDKHTIRETNNTNITTKNKNYIYLVEYRLNEDFCEQSYDCTLKRILCNKITDKLAEVLDNYQTSIDKLNLDGNPKVELTVQYMNKKIVKDGEFEMLNIF